jgi:CheY-like chemotaxis protein
MTRSCHICRPKILLVEDNFLVRFDLVLGLEDHGFTVIDAGSAEQALEMICTDDEPPFEVVVTDINLGAGIDGMQFADRLRSRWPDLAIVFISGDVGQLRWRPPHPFECHLGKPCGVTELDEAISRLIRTYAAPAGSPPHCCGRAARQTLS